MNAHPPRVPKLHHHRASGRAFAIFNGRWVYFGPWGSKAAEEAYRRKLHEWLSQGRQFLPDTSSSLTVGKLALLYIRHAKAYYPSARDWRKDGEFRSLSLAVRAATLLYGKNPAEKFGPKALDAVRKGMIRANLSRTHINHQIGRIRRMFRWAVSQELIPPSVLVGLQSLPGLRQGRTEAREAKPIVPVPWEHVEPILPRLSPAVRAMVLLGWHTGARMGEIVLLRWTDIDTRGRVWFFRPATHKTAWRGKERTIAIGPKGQAVLQEWPRLDRNAFIFSPRDSERARAEREKTEGWNRKTLSSAAVARLGEHYSTNTVRLSIRDACLAVGVPLWSPHQLRHAFATEVAKKHGLVVAQTLLGHSHPTTTALYAARDQAVAERVMLEF